MIRRLADRAGGAIGAALTALAARRARGRPIVVLDVDNTLADSWPTFARTWPGERARLDAIEPLRSVKAVAHDAAVERGDAVLFLTHRGWRHWEQTVRWLRRHGFAASPLNVVLVARPADKIGHLRRLARAGPVTYWDDLSHSHELGEPVLHAEVIAAVGRLDVDHVGWATISALAKGSTDDG